MNARAIAVVGLISGCGLAATGAQQPVPVEQRYQNRGTYNEGVRVAPSTVPVLDLLGAVVDHDEPYIDLPSRFQLAFYLPEPVAVTVTVREAQNRYYYWLDGITPRNGWEGFRVNTFPWQTSVVVKSLVHAPGGPLRLSDLTAAVRLPPLGQDMPERILPAVFFHSRMPATATGYTFSFRPSTATRFEFSVVPDAGLPIVCRKTSRTKGLATEWFSCPAATWADGWYRLRVSAVSEDTNTERRTDFAFFHKGSLDARASRLE